jgi:hypothetical protein
MYKILHIPTGTYLLYYDTPWEFLSDFSAKQVIDNLEGYFGTSLIDWNPQINWSNFIINEFEVIYDKV